MAVVVVYPGVFAFASMLSTASAMSGVFQIWSQGVRDKEFLVELRLQNRDEASKAKSPELESILK
jgi:E3 ubiquitin-protein ligase MARCH6